MDSFFVKKKFLEVPTHKNINGRLSTSSGKKYKLNQNFKSDNSNSKVIQKMTQNIKGIDPLARGRCYVHGRRHHHRNTSAFKLESTRFTSVFNRF